MAHGVKWLALSLVVAIPALAQLQSSQADFTKALTGAIKSLKIKQPPAVDLPDAVSCEKTSAAYRCEWKSRANKASVTALESAIVGRVAAALPGDWKRDSVVRNGQRFTRFHDPAGPLTIEVIGKASEDGSPPWDYTVRLNALLNWSGYGNSQR